MLAVVGSDYDAKSSGSSLAEGLAIARHNLVMAAIAERKAVSPDGDGVVAYDKAKGEFCPVWYIGKPNGRDFADENAAKAKEANEAENAAYWASMKSASKAARKAGKTQPEWTATRVSAGELPNSNPFAVLKGKL